MLTIFGSQERNARSGYCDGVSRRGMLKIGALVRVTFRKVWIRLSESCPYQTIFQQVYAELMRRMPVPFP